MSDYRKAKELGLTSRDRWFECVYHHPRSEQLMKFIQDHDLNDFGDYFCWKTGGDGDNGETLMYQMDAFFELQDLCKKSKKKQSKSNQLAKERQLGFDFGKGTI